MRHFYETASIGLLLARACRDGLQTSTIYLRVLRGDRRPDAPIRTASILPVAEYSESAMMVPLELRFYTADSGNSPVERYLESLEARERAAVLHVLNRIRCDGFGSAGVTTRQIDGKLWEVKVSRHRLFYVTAGGVVVLLHAYKKQRQKAPRAEIDIARTRMKDVLDG